MPSDRQVNRTVHACDQYRSLPCCLPTLALSTWCVKGSLKLHCRYGIVMYRIAGLQTTCNRPARHAGTVNIAYSCNSVPHLSTQPPIDLTTVKLWYNSHRLLARIASLQCTNVTALQGCKTMGPCPIPRKTAGKSILLGRPWKTHTKYLDQDRQRGKRCTSDTTSSLDKLQGGHKISNHRIQREFAQRRLTALPTRINQR